MKPNQPLKHKTILITRSANQVADFIQQLQDLGAITITLPLIENNPINQPELATKVTQTNYDWIIFTSTNAVRFFFETVSPQDISARIAAVGSKTAQLIKDQGLTIDFTPSEFTAKHLANEIPVETNQQILIPRSNLAKNDVVSILTTRNCIVDPISIYENTSIKYAPAELTAIFEQSIDYITFTSGSTVASFLDLGIELDTEKIICIGPETAKIAEQGGLSVTAIATPHTIEGMVKTMVATN